MKEIRLYEARGNHLVLQLFIQKFRGGNIWSNINLHARSLKLILWGWITVLIIPIPKCPTAYCASAVCYNHMCYFTFADTRLILKLLQWVMRCSRSFTIWALALGWLRERFIIDEATFWASLLWRRMVQPRLTQRFSVRHSDWSAVSAFHGGRERMSYLSLEASPCNCYCVVTCRHMRVWMTLTLNVHIKELDHSKMKFLHYYLVTVTSF